MPERYVFDPQKCEQCRSYSSNFKHDRRTGGYGTACLRCGRRECHHPKRDEDGSGDMGRDNRDDSSPSRGVPAPSRPEPLLGKTTGSSLPLF
jgi:hypothetical protein